VQSAKTILFLKITTY